MTTRLIRITQIVGVTTVLCGLSVFAPLQYAWLQKERALASAPSVIVPAIAPPKKPSTITGHPVRLSIPSLSVDLPIIDGTYNATNGEWTLSEESTHFALPSSPPNNESGNTLIYGHNNKLVFGTLYTITPGAEAIVTTDNGYRFVYQFTNAEQIKPTDTTVFTYNGVPRLTLQTCSGYYMQNRHMHYFSFVRYEKL